MLDQETISIFLTKQPYLLVYIAIVTIILGPTILYYVNRSTNKRPKKPVVNYTIKKDNPKVVDTIDCGEIERIAEYKDGKLVMCRCWKSKNFPYCDGAHNKHNAETGDNVGPLIIKA